jgi:hypothetical protein
MPLSHLELPILEYGTLAHHARGRWCTNLAAIRDVECPIWGSKPLSRHNSCLLLEMISNLRKSNTS